MKEAKIYVNFMENKKEAKPLLEPEAYALLLKNKWIPISSERRREGLPKAIVVLEW
jgi:hypothetical protein